MKRYKFIGQGFCLMLLCLFIVGCTSPQLVLKNPRPEVLRVSIGFTEEVPDIVRNELETQFNKYILWHNARPSGFKLELAEAYETVDLQFTVLASKLVTSDQQTAGVFLSMIGLSLPIIMASAGAEFVVFFYYFPRTNSVMELALDPELSAGPLNKINYHVSSPGFLKSEQRQVDRHGQYFFDALRKIFVKMDKK